jgi:hypothetical protein
MSRSHFWDTLQIVGALASIIALVAFLRDQPSLGVALASVLILGVFAVITASIMARRGVQRPVGRDAMIHTGRRLIIDVKKEAIMFGGDMSWANDYEEAIRSATGRGKRVRVLYPRSDTPKVRRNEQILSDAGADLLPTPIDSGLRAILVDPEDSKDALLYVVSRTLRSGAVPVQEGEHGSETNYRYLAKVYTMGGEWVIIHAAKKIYEVLLTATQKVNQ